MATANELLHDALLQRQIYLSRFSSGLSNDIIALLDATERDLRAEIRDRMADLEGKAFSARTNSRLNVLANSIRRIREAGFTAMADMWSDTLEEVAQLEADYINNAIQDVSPVRVNTVLPDPVQLATLVSLEPVRGRLMSEWVEGMSDADVDRIMSEVRIGMANGEGMEEIVRRVVGTGVMDGADGATETTRREARSLTRTAVQSFANGARQAWTAANDDIIKREKFVATLDSRTTPICRSQDGKIYAVGTGPVPPLHFQCRSLRVPLLGDELIGRRPANASTEDMLEGLSRQERRAKLRDLIGQVPAETTYQDWLTSQTSAFQDDVLGPSRGALFRKGGLTLDQFVNRRGDNITLEQLRQQHPSSFRRAGL